MNKIAETPDYSADICRSAELFLERWEALLDEHSSPFHSLVWMRAWYDKLGSTAERTPLFVGVKRRDTGADVMLLALVQRRRWGLSLVEFADAGVVDYVSPLVAAEWAGCSPDDTGATAASAQRLWQAMRLALRGHDLLCIEKMLGEALGECPRSTNPLMFALHVQTCEMSVSQFHVAHTWDAWLNSLGKDKRRNLQRAWHSFTRSEGALFERITDPSKAFETYAMMEEQQATRMQQRQGDYLLDRTEYSAFYRQALADGLADGRVVLTALRDGEHLVAAQLGIANRNRYVALRQTMGGDQWHASSPGRLLNERTAYHLYEQGLRWFDFGIGSYRHKQMFRVSQIPLYDACEALSWRGVPVNWAWRLRRALKRQAWLVALWRHIKSGITREPAETSVTREKTEAPGPARS